LSLNDKPDGNTDAVQPPTGLESLNDGVGTPVVVTVNVPDPVLNVFVLELVICGAPTQSLSDVEPVAAVVSPAGHAVADPAPGEST
jgi:hypothetical protein